MTDEHRMEQLSRAYVQAVAAVCGCRWSIPVPDYGVDVNLRRVMRRGGRYREVGPSLYLQLKSTTVPAAITPEHVSYDLDVGAYNILRNTTRDSPSLLVLLVLPTDRVTWVDHTEDRLELRRCAYWLSLRRQPVVSNVATVRIQIPRTNQFTPGQLERIMEIIQRKEDVR
jgi:hypothetical protein